MTAALTMDLLEADGREWTDLYPQLLVSQGIARKKYADQLFRQDPAGTGHAAVWREAGDIFRRALAVYGDNGSSRLRQAYEELIVLAARPWAIDSDAPTLLAGFPCGPDTTEA